MLKNKKKFIILGFLFFLVVALYYPVWDFEYVWDDTLLFVGKTGLLTQPLTWALISEPVLPGTTYFRPLVFLSWYIEFNTLGQSASISHAIGLLFLYFNSCLVFALAYLLALKIHKTNALLLALFAACFYILHPALIESTAWVSGRFDQFCTFFILLACVFFVKNQLESTKIKFLTIFLINISFFCALLSKELGLILPAILFLLNFMLLQQNPHLNNYNILKKCLVENKVLWISLVVVLSIYFWLRLKMMPSMYHDSITVDYIQKSILKDWLPLHTLYFYIKQTFLPFSSVNILHPLDEWNFQSKIERFKGISALVLIVFIVWLAWFKRNMSAWLTLIALITVILVLNIIPLSTSGNLGHERFMTLGLAFVGIALVFVPYQQILKKLKMQYKMQKILSSVILITWCLLSVMTIKSALPLWKSDYTLWSWTYKLHPNVAIARYNYFYGALQSMQYMEVIDEAEKYSKKHNGLEVADQLAYASALINTSNPEGLKYFEGAIYALPKFHESKDPDARRKADFFRITASQMAGAYTSYAIGQMMFNADIEKAKEYLEIAEWYLLLDQKEVLNYQRVAILFADEKYDEALALYKENKTQSLKNKSEKYKITGKILTTYCQNNIDQKDVCHKFKQTKIFF